MFGEVARRTKNKIEKPFNRQAERANFSPLPCLISRGKFRRADCFQSIYFWAAADNKSRARIRRGSVWDLGLAKDFQNNLLVFRRPPQISISIGRLDRFKKPRRCIFLLASPENSLAKPSGIFFGISVFRRSKVALTARVRASLFILKLVVKKYKS